MSNAFESPAKNENYTMFDTDLVRELRLRKWAREHFVAEELRKPCWHPIVLEEMKLRDRELELAPVVSAISRSSLIDDELDPPSLCHLLDAGPEDSALIIDDASQNSGSRIVPIFPHGNAMIHPSGGEIQGPHWHLPAYQNQMMSGESDLIGYY